MTWTPRPLLLAFRDVPSADIRPCTTYARRFISDGLMRARASQLSILTPRGAPAQTVLDTTAMVGRDGLCTFPPAHAVRESRTGPPCTPLQRSASELYHGVSSLHSPKVLASLARMLLAAFTATPRREKRQCASLCGLCKCNKRSLLFFGVVT